MQIEHSTWQHCNALQLCVAYCLCSLSTLHCGVKKSLHTTNKTVFLAHIILLVGSACQNTLGSANDVTKAETTAVWRLSIINDIYIYTYISGRESFLLLAQCLITIKFRA